MSNIVKHQCIVNALELSSVEASGRFAAPRLTLKIRRRLS